MDTQRFLRVIRRFFKENYGSKVEMAIFRLDDGGKVQMPVKIKTCKPAGHTCKLAGQAEQLDEAEMDVLSHVPEHNAEPATAQKIANDANRKCNSYFSGILRRLRKKNKIVLDVGGYRKVKDAK